jgi:hypothetical protein
MARPGFAVFNAEGFYMYQSHITGLRGSQRSYSLSVPVRRVSEVRTIIIACSEIGALPESRELEMLGPLAYLTLPGGNVLLEDGSEQDADVARFLESLLMSAQHAEFVITCFHTRCSYFDYGTTSGEPLACLDASDEGDERLAFLGHQRGALLGQQALVKQQLERLKKIFKSNKQLANRNISVNGWLYETEIDWVSFYDSDTDMFLPLSAKAELYR